MGIVSSDVFYFDETDNYMITLKFDKDGFYVNGVKIDRTHFESVEDSKTPEMPKQENIPPEVWTYPDYFMDHFEDNTNLSLQLGSREGTTRTWVTYEYIKYHHNL